jgi:quercetin dioxygenase-like cupin family protein
VRATLSPPATQPLWFIHNLARVHVDGDTSDGKLALVEFVGARGDMPPLHVHQADDETFFVLQGELTLFAGDQVVRLQAGSAVLAPRGIPHAYRVESEQARWLVACTPAGFDAFVREVGEPAPQETLPPADIEVDPARIGDAAARHGIELLGPPATLPSA